MCSSGCRSCARPWPTQIGAAGSAPARPRSARLRPPPPRARLDPAWIDRELAARLVAALRREGEDARARALLEELESRLMGLATAGRFDARLQEAVLRHGVFAAVEARLADPDPGGPVVSDGCAALVMALVSFNRDVFVGPMLMGPAVGALVDAASSTPSSPSTAPLPALNGLVDAIRTPLVDELHGRGELPRLVALLCAANPRVRALALELVLRVAYYGRREVLDALLDQGLVKRVLCLQRSDLDVGGSATDTDASQSDSTGETPLSPSRRPFVSAVARFAVQVEVGQGLGLREKRAAKLDILRRVREEALRGQAVLDATSDPSAVVGSAKKFLAGIKALFVCSAEVDRLTQAVEALEQLAGTGGDLLDTLHRDTLHRDVWLQQPWTIICIDEGVRGGGSVYGADVGPAGADCRLKK